MDQVRISELNPEQPALESKHFKATVTLIWPYSSSARQFALLLAEPDFRLRRKKGQVRARFSGSSAKAIATTGVGIGDEVILSLRGAQFVQEGAVNTPGKSIDWELSYTQTVVVHVFRNGSEIANLELVDVAPTPAPPSPVRREPVAAPSPAHQWSSPAFLKRVRLSDGPFFEAPYDPLADGNEEGHDKKRRRKSYRDWKAWTYNARTPSPEKEHDSMEEDSDAIAASPSRPTQLPDTPVSPAKAGMLSVAAKPLDRVEDVERTQQRQASAHDELVSRPKQDDFVRDADYYELYAGPNELPPSDAQYAFGGDTEVNTEEEDGVQDEPDVVSLSTTEANTEEDDRLHSIEQEAVEIESPASEEELAKGDTEGATEEDSLVDVAGHVAETLSDGEEDSRNLPYPAMTEEVANLHEAPTIVMPPPTLPTLQTNFAATVATGLLTPIGREPASPTLQPLDSATLPLPSPFPGERDSSMTSYLDYVAAGQQPEMNATSNEDPEPPSDAGYILENSFFSSINSSTPSGLHQNHETAFTPVRFTFGMDGAGFSRPMDLSSPAPEEAPLDIKGKGQESAGQLASDVQQDVVVALDTHMSVPLPQETVHEETSPQDVEERAEILSENSLGVLKEPEVIELSSGSESEESEESEVESDAHADNEEDAEVNDYQNQAKPDEINVNLAETKQTATEGSTSTHQSTAVSGVFDLGSPSEDNSDEDSHVPVAEPNFFDRIGNEAVDERQMFGTYSSPRLDQHQDQSRNTDPDQSPDVESPSEFVNMNYSPEVTNATAVLEEGTSTHTQAQQDLGTSFDHVEEEQSLTVGGYDSQLPLVDSDAYMQDVFPLDEPQHMPGWESLGAEEHHPDIKMESIEAESLFHISQSHTQQVDDGDRQHTASNPEDLPIDVPEESHKLGEQRTTSVPATGPARNTRSKTKVSVSPPKDETPAPKRTTRSTRSKASVTSIARSTLSPPKTRTRSTASPSQDATQTSPYSLRSQSKLLSSPTGPSAVATATTRKSSRKHASHGSVESISDRRLSPLDDRDPFRMGFEPSQELSASQGRYSNVSFVKDSEEESLRSEQSISTVRYSDNWGGTMQFTNVSDPVEATAQDNDPTQLKPPPASAPQAKTKPAAKTTRKKTELQIGNQAKSSSPPQPTHPSANSPGRRLRSAGPAETASPSPRILRTTRKQVYDLSSEPQEPIEEFSDEVTPRPSAAGEGEDHQIRSSPPPAPNDVDALTPPATAALPIAQQSTIDSNMLITPEDTQQTTMELQPNLTTAQQGDDLLMTPQLTQATSTGNRSFQTDVDVVETTVATRIKTSPIAKSTPRRNVTAIDVASASASPRSEAASPSSSVAEPEQPSIGLSTPLAYYTPLKDLLYFLNRSSEFHSASNPDVLALVTSSTTPSEKAKKGPKHWNTTLHVTDASTWPTTTTVQIFRAYQTALPHADAGDIILLRAFAVKSLNRHPTLVSSDESAWCVWRYGKPVWGAKRGAYGEIRAREEMKGPTVERGEGEWREVERLRMWWVNKVKAELEEKEAGQVKTRSKDKVVGNGELKEEVQTRVKTRSKDKEEEKAANGSTNADDAGESQNQSQRTTRSKGKEKVVASEDT